MKIIIDNNSSDILAGKLGNIINKAINNNGFATLVIAGGSTPKAMLNKLFLIPLAWQKVTFYFSDERYVPACHKDSNENMLRKCLVAANLAQEQQPKIISYYQKGNSIDQAVTKLAGKLATIDNFDAVVVGMGLDGHFASLFPDDELLADKLELNNPQLCCAVQTKNSPHQRISLTLSCLLKTKHFYILIAGAEKLKVLQKAKLGLETENYQMPISALYQPAIEKNRIHTYYQEHLNL